MNISKELLGDIVFALSTRLPEGFFFYDRTDGDVKSLSMYPSFYEDEDEETILSDNEWEAETVQAYLNHDVIIIRPIPSYEAFALMENFAESVTSEEARMKLFHALERKHPFSRFKDALFKLGLLDQWYKVEDGFYKKEACKWYQMNVEGQDDIIEEDLP